VAAFFHLDEYFGAGAAPKKTECQSPEIPETSEKVLCAKNKNVNLPNVGKRKFIYTQLSVAGKRNRISTKKKNKIRKGKRKTRRKPTSKPESRAVSALPQQPPPTVQSNFRNIVLRYPHTHSIGSVEKPTPKSKKENHFNFLGLRVGVLRNPSVGI